MDEEKLFRQANELKILIYDIESLSKILNLFMFQNNELIEHRDLAVLSEIISQKISRASKMCCRHEHYIEQVI